MNKYNYCYDNYELDVEGIVNTYKKIPNPHIVGVYRGSLPVATHLSNLLECPMSIIKFQHMDGNDKKAEWLLNLTEDVSIRPEGTKQFFPRLIVIDDIYDTGTTFRAIKELPEFHNNPDYSLMALFGNKNDDGVGYIHEQEDRWIVFPHERM
jgi:hypoxanthine phosphoribosyltransferase|tara:strand:+ start:513 stop:968 length:456 start_codon:yes stop_codon:yes gene_type:complete